MSLLKKFKYAFGFGDAMDDPLIEDDPDTIVVTEKKTIVSPITPNNQASQQREITTSNSKTNVQASDVFEHVVTIFNQALPDFLQKSVDPAAERKALYDSLNDDLKAYIERSRVQAEIACRSHFEKEKTKLQANIREMEGRYREFEEKRNELNQKSLSAERQKRALNERIHDLEAKILELEAEREQFQLENKSLLNKVKVSSVFEKENEALHDELQRLQKELNGLRNNTVNNPLSVSASNTAELEEEIVKLKDALAKASEESETQKQNLLKKESEIADVQSQLAKLQKTHSDLIHENEENKEVMAQLVKEVESAQSHEPSHEMEISEEMTRQLREIEIEMEKFQEIKDKKDHQINKLKNELEEANNKIGILERTVTMNLEMQSKSEKKLGETLINLKAAVQEKDKEIESLKRQLGRQKKAGQSRSQVRENKAFKPQNDEVTPIEDILSDTEWVDLPGSMRGSRKSSSSSHSQEDKNAGNDSQLSLF